MAFSLYEYYKESVKNKEITCDQTQIKASIIFDKLFLSINKNLKKKNFPFFNLSLIKNFFKIPSLKIKEKKGIYLYGNVGRGKTLLMDMFYELIPIKKKIRIHLHHFILEAQKEISGTDDSKLVSIEDYAESFCKNYNLLCLDEFYVDHIGDAMFLRRLFEKFFAKGIFIVLTSNTKPKDLYKGGISRELFLPVIPFIEDYMNVISLDGDNDYRTKGKSQKESTRYFIGKKVKTTKYFYSLFKKEIKNNSVINIGTHSYKANKISDNMIWFSFNELCEKPCGKKDYISLVQNFKIWFLTDIPILRPNQYNEAKRFITLIDVLYDYGVKLWVNAETIPSLIYIKGRDINSFKRTVSRIIQMTREEYKSFGN